MCMCLTGFGCVMFARLRALIDDRAICVSQVKLFDAAICLQRGPVVS